ncbi:MAG: sce7725 family protein [Prolixibacteraceae bacterium]|nr:sce7725 family protein [Prolixibacteraceae bacterium]
MYYPYLRGKQFELLALREFAEKYSDDCNVFPIIEPVKSSFNSMKLALKKLQEKEISYALVMNPQVGDLIRNKKAIETELEQLLEDKDLWIPAYIVNSNSKGIIRQLHIKDYNHVMLICQDSVDSNDPDFEELIGLPEVSKVLISNDNRSLKRKLQRSGKDVIRLDDNFKPQKKNSDYVGILEEKFTEEHRYYAEEDKYQGLGDYTVLTSDFLEGGRLPYAVAIHLTYEKNSDEIWVRHFVSDTNDDNTNIQGKFGEAAEKAVQFFEQIPYSNDSIAELTGYYRNGQYPGLGVLKKISIKNHLELMNTILTH